MLSTGNVILNVAPCPGPALSTVIRPPCRSTMRLTIERPSPVEVSPAVGLAESRWKRPNSREISSGERPAPWSLTWTTIPSASLRHQEVDGAADRAVFDGVADQIVDRLADAVGIAHAPIWSGGADDRDGLLLAGGERPVGLGHLLHQDGDVDRLAPDRDVERVGHGVGHQVVDHLGEPVGGVADIGDLRLHVVVERAGAGDHLLEDLGAAEDDAQRVLQVVGDGAEDLALEGVGLPQPRPLRGEPAVGVGQVLRALGDPLLEAGVGRLQLLVEDDVVEGDGEPAAEDLHQRAVGVGEVARRLQHDHDLAAAHRLDVEHRAARPRTRAGGG